MKIIIHWIILTLAVLATPYVVSGIHVDGLLTAVVVAAVLGFINTVVKPLVTILTLPINIITLGLFSVVLNGLFFWFVAVLVSGFSIDTFIAAIWGAFVVSILNWIVSKAFGE
ncbi:MAG: phage holin family protein [Candidatus Pacebacteria bacterium]|nr:phage holin family protein [Candidatus Paceibacterota bacterium]MBP9852233.1 phage holin family protein [Candidatus Paceibacterota bacterium]